MPYDSNSDLPKAVREALPAKAQSIFREAFNSAIDEGHKESVAFQVAWGAVENAGYSQDSDGNWRKKSDTSWRRDFEVRKVDQEQQLVFGWLSVAFDKDGNQIEDSQGDLIDEIDLEKAAYDYNIYARKSGEMHQKVGVGRLVESMVFTKEKQEALGIPDGILPVGWWVGYKIDDLDVWGKVKSGEYSMFSIGGKARREEVS